MRGDLRRELCGVPSVHRKLVNFSVKLDERCFALDNLLGENIRRNGRNLALLGDNLNALRKLVQLHAETHACFGIKRNEFFIAVTQIKGEHGKRVVKFQNLVRRFPRFVGELFQEKLQLRRKRFVQGSRRERTRFGVLRENRLDKFINQRGIKNLDSAGGKVHVEIFCGTVEKGGVAVKKVCKAHFNRRQKFPRNAYLRCGGLFGGGRFFAFRVCHLDACERTRGAVTLGNELQILVAEFRILDALDERFRLRDKCGSVFGTVVRHGSPKIAEPVFGGAERFPEGVRALLVYEVVRVNFGAVRSRKRKNFWRKAFGQHDFETAARGILPGGISVKYKVSGLCVAGENAGMILGKCRTRCGYDVLHSALVKADEVEISFDDNDRILLHDGVSAVVQTEENIALAVKGGLRAVHVLGKLYSVVRCGVAQVSTAKGDNDSREILDGNH